MRQVNIPCPVCQGSINTDIELLLQGKGFSCSNPKCKASIQLSDESKVEVESAYNKLQHIKDSSKNNIS